MMLKVSTVHYGLPLLIRETCRCDRDKNKTSNFRCADNRAENHNDKSKTLLSSVSIMLKLF